MKGDVIIDFLYTTVRYHMAMIETMIETRVYFFFPPPIFGLGPPALCSEALIWLDTLLSVVFSSSAGLKEIFRPRVPFFPAGLFIPGVPIFFFITCFFITPLAILDSALATFVLPGELIPLALFIVMFLFTLDALADLSALLSFVGLAPPFLAGDFFLATLIRSSIIGSRLCQSAR